MGLLGTYAYPLSYSPPNRSKNMARDGAEVDRGESPTGTKWLGPLKTHLRQGVADVRDGNGIAARVSGEAGAIQPRTGESEVALHVALYPSAASVTPNSFAHAIITHKAAFVSRSTAAHDTHPAACQFKIAPLGHGVPADVPAPLTGVA